MIRIFIIIIKIKLVIQILSQIPKIIKVKADTKNLLSVRDSELESETENLFNIARSLRAWTGSQSDSKTKIVVIFLSEYIYYWFMVN